jgi:hypothetical protein
MPETRAVGLQAADQASTCLGTPSSSMPETRALGLQATDQASTCLRSSLSFPEMVSPLTLGFGPASRGFASLEISNPVNIWPGLYIWRFARNMMPTSGLCKHFASINLGGHSQTFIEVVLQLSLPFPSLSISLQVIIKPVSFLGLEAEGVDTVVGCGKYTDPEQFILYLMSSCHNRGHRSVSSFSLSAKRVLLITS